MAELPHTAEPARWAGDVRLEEWRSSADLRQVGKPLVRRSAIAKVTGRAAYTADVRLPGMLHAVIVRAKVPHGHVTAIDATAAERVSGVRLVLTPESFPAMPEERSANGAVVHRRPPIAADVHFVGQEIGAVVAETQAAAEDAAGRLVVHYEALPAVIEPEDALRAGAPLVTPQGNLVGGETRVYQRGDLASGEAAARWVRSSEYSTEVQHHNPLEPHCCVAEWQGGVLTLWDSTQGPHAVRDHLVTRLGLPASRVRVLCTFTGGGFGSKNRSKPHHYIAAIAARITARPVRLWIDRRDEFIAARHRAKTRRTLRGGVGEDHGLTFLSHEVTGQDGADPLLAGVAADTGSTERLYRCANVRTEVRQVHTNTQSPVSFRGPTAAEEVFCLEQFVDELAHLAGEDPLTFRLRNHAAVDQVDGQPYSSDNLRRCYELGADRFGWQWRPPTPGAGGPVRRGIGLAAFRPYCLNYEDSQVTVTLESDGSIAVQAGVSEMGTGIENVLAQVVAEELGVEVDAVEVISGDSALPYSIDSSYGSRTTELVGPTARAAAAQARHQLLERAARKIGLPVEDLEIVDAEVRSRRDPARRVAVRAVLGELGRQRILGIGQRHAAMPGVNVAGAAVHFVEVEVDADLGAVRVVRAVCAHDAGRWINPLLVESQIQGAFIQGMGMALFEERAMDRRNGVQINDCMLSYFMPGPMDAPPEIAALDVATPDPSNSINAKGIGEPPLIAAGAAIANALYNALGVRLRAYPLTPDKVLAALRQAERGED
jgi:CO/xanthine dehydrogenase Mo-binding subunit